MEFNEKSQFAYVYIPMPAVSLKLYTFECIHYTNIINS